jgi:hypothetical protein
MADLVQRHADRILGVLSCYDRVFVRGRIPGLDYAKGMESYLRARDIRLFDFPKFAMPFREAIRDNAEQLAQAEDIEVQFIRNRDVRKEDIVVLPGRPRPGWRTDKTAQGSHAPRDGSALVHGGAL